MPLLDQMLRQRFVVDAGGFQSEDHPAKTLPVHVKTHLGQQVPEALGIVLDDQPFEQRSAVGITKEGVVLAFGDIKPDDEIILGSSNVSLELTEFIDSVNLDLVHGNLLLAVKRLWVMATLGYQEVTALSSDNFFPLCYTSKNLLLFFEYITYLIISFDSSPLPSSLH